MLFFFEMFLFVLVMLTLALGEFVSRWLALVLWLVVTTFTLVGYLLARQSLRGIITSGDAPPLQPPGPSLDAELVPPEAESVPPSAAEAPPARRVPPEGFTAAPREVTPLDAKWARTLLYNWRRTNALLMLGALAVGGWYWLGR
jgi:hypothetical protein